MSEPYSECLLHLPPSQRACASCEKLRECAFGMKTITGGDRTLAELRSADYECLLGLSPIFRECATCPKLYECLHGQKVVHGDYSITDKVLLLDWIPTTEKLKKMTLEQLREFNVAFDTYNRREKTKEKNQGLTAGAYDREREKYVTDIVSGEDAVGVEGDSVGKGLTVGFWDAKKRRWVAKK